MSQTYTTLARKIHSCEKCPRLRSHCLEIAREKRRAYQDQTYWGKPISGFGDPNGRLLIVGLAPAAHGANRTGRIFTGDRSGDWLYRALHKQGFANQPHSTDANDGLELDDAFITCIVKCAPPENKPLPAEIAACSAFLNQELEILSRARVIIALGQIALAGIWPKISAGSGLKSRPRFSHDAQIDLPRPTGGNRTLLLSYHPSQQNTFTGRLTEPMFDRVFFNARRIIDAIHDQKP